MRPTAWWGSCASCSVPTQSWYEQRPAARRGALRRHATVGEAAGQRGHRRWTGRSPCRVAVQAQSRWTIRVRPAPLGGFVSMAIAVETKDCTQLSDAELAEMAD